MFQHNSNNRLALADVQASAWLQGEVAEYEVVREAMESRLQPPPDPENDDQEVVFVDGPHNNGVYMGGDLNDDSD